MNLFPFLFKAKRGSTTEPKTWTERVDDTEPLYSIISDGTTWFAGGDGNSYYSTDPKSASWTLQSGPSTGYVRAALYDGTYFLADCLDYPNGKIKSATNPSGTWTEESSIGYSDMRDMAWDGSSYYVVAGRTSSSGNLDIIVATDPTGTWTRYDSVIAGSGLLMGVAYGNSKWVIVGGLTSGPTSKMSYTGSNPTTGWTANTNHPFSGFIYSVAYGNGYWVATGDSGRLATTKDPTGTWTKHASSPFTSSVVGVTYANNAWVAVGYNGEIGTCGADPTGTWTLRVQVESGSFKRVNYSNGIWVAVGTLGIYTAVPGV